MIRGGDVWHSAVRDNQRFRLVVDAVPNAILVVDRDGRILFANLRAEDLFGYERDELLGEGVDRLVPDRFRPGHFALVQGFLRQPTARAMAPDREVHARHKDGRDISIEIGLTPIVTDDGAPATVVWINDITERKRAEARFRLAVEAAPNAMIMVDRQRRITLVNRKAEELFGYARAAMAGQPVEMLLPQRFHAAHHHHVADFFASPQARAMGAGRELFALRSDGREVPVEIGLNPIETPDGTFILAAIIDITERLLARAADDRLAAIVESSDDAILSKTPDGIITTWNKGAQRLFGYAPEEAVGRHVRMLVPERHRAADPELLAASGAIERFDAVRRRRNGSEIDVSVTVSPMRDSRGELAGTSAILRDVSELKRRDAELRRSNAELEQFAYVASHDLQEPLRMIANYTELLAQRYQGRLDERADRYIRYASEGSRRMQRLVADLLAYSRVGSQGKEPAVVSSQGVLERVLALLQDRLATAGAVVTHGALPAVLADDLQLGQLFQNLIGNAVKFRSDQPPRVTIAAERDGVFWTFAITDNGIGMDMHHTERIFQMFQRLHERGQFEGSGIGLAIAKRIVERHGGRIWVQSVPGEGSTFRFTLPAAPEAA